MITLRKLQGLARSFTSLDDKVKKAEAEVKKLKKQRETKKEELISAMTSGNETIKFSNSTNNFAVTEDDVPTIKNFDKFYEYVVDNDAPELLHKRINTEAWRDHSCKVPGVQKYTRRSLSVTTRRK